MEIWRLATCGHGLHRSGVTETASLVRLRTQITMDDFLCAVNAFGELRSEESQAGDVQQAFRVFDESSGGKVSAARLRATLTTLGERLSDDDVDAMMALLGDEPVDDIDYTSLIEKLTSV